MHAGGKKIETLVAVGVAVFVFSAVFTFMTPANVFAGGGNDGQGGGRAGNGFSNTPGVADHPGQGGYGLGSPSSLSGRDDGRGGSRGSGGRYYTPPPPPPPPSFDSTTDAYGGKLNEGHSATLTWSGVQSSSCSGVNFSTGGAVSGSAVVTPTDTTTYTVVCSNGGRASKTITIVRPKLKIQTEDDRIPVDTRTTITWSSDADVVESCSVTEDNPEVNDVWSGSSGSETTSILGFETIYTLTCTTSAGDTSESATVRIIPFFQEF